MKTYRSAVYIRNDGYSQDFDTAYRRLQESTEKCFHFLNQYDFGDGEITTEPPYGTTDTLYRYGNYIISFNWNLEYFALTEIIESEN